MYIINFRNLKIVIASYLEITEIHLLSDWLVLNFGFAIAPTYLYICQVFVKSFSSFVWTNSQEEKRTLVYWLGKRFKGISFAIVLAFIRCKGEERECRVESER